MLRIPHCLDNRLTDNGKVVSPTHRPRSTLLSNSQGLERHNLMQKPALTADSALVLNWGGTYVAPVQNDQPLVTSKSRLYFEHIAALERTEI
jgi:hypothetical protein